MPFEDWEKLVQQFLQLTIVLPYDNMCHLDSMRMFKKPLPPKGNFTFILQKLTHAFIVETSIMHHLGDSGQKSYKAIIKVILLVFMYNL